MTRSTPGIRPRTNPETLLPELERSRLLDRPTEPSPFLNAVMSHTLGRLLLTANGATFALRERTNGGDRNMEPRADMTCREMSRRFARAQTHRARLMLILEAQGELRRCRGADRASVRGTDEWYAAVRQDKRPYRTIADRYGIGLATISRIKQGQTGVPSVA